MSDTLMAAPPDLSAGESRRDKTVRRLPWGRGKAASWWIAGFFCLAAFGYIALAATTFRAVAVAADRLEEAYRMAPSNVVGRGACTDLARIQPPIMFDPDSECWINLTQQQYQDGTIRPHTFPFDNAPYGRERHWSSSFSWWLLLLAWLAHAAVGLPVETAIAQVAPWANPVLFACFVLVLAGVLRPKIGAWTTGALILTFTTMPGVEWDFSSGHPDHHGLHLMAYTGLFLGALLAGMGWVQVAGAANGNEPADQPVNLADRFVRGLSSRRQARFWLAASGVCGGIGLWIGSTQQIVCIGVLGMGVVLAALCFASRWTAGAGNRFEPELWRHWCRVGAMTSLAFYLLEYFPNHLGMRTEVNHPLIALGWAGAGELMWVVTMAKVDWPGLRDDLPSVLAHLVLGLFAMAALPLAILLGPREWFVLGNPIIRWSAGMISEGQPWLDWRHPAAALQEIWTYTGVLMLALPLAAGLLLRPRRACAAWQRGGLLTLWLMTVTFLGWTLVQYRWIGFLEISLVLLTLVSIACLPLSGRPAAFLPLILLVVFLPNWLESGMVQVRTRAENPARHARVLLGSMMSMKEAAWNLDLHTHGRRPARVMAPPGASPTLHYYGGVDTVGSYYWENLSGCQATIDFYNDPSDREARRIARERGLDFVLAIGQPSFALELQILKLGRLNIADVRRTLAFRLSSPSPAGVPDWLERLPLLDAPMAEADGIRIYRVRRDRL